MAAAKLKKNMKKIYYFHNQQACHNEFDRFKVVICINRLSVHDTIIQLTYVGSLQALGAFSNFADTCNILVAFSKCTERPPQVPIFVFIFLQIR